MTAERNRANATHGMSRSKQYFAWRAMKVRCLVPGSPEYDNYGGRGITICDRWLDFKNFLEDMGEPPSGKRVSLGRRDNDGSYCKENCRWETPKEQANNSRANRRLTFEGQTLTVGQWAEKTGISRRTIQGRIARGLPIYLVLGTQRLHSLPHSARMK